MATYTVEQLVQAGGSEWRAGDKHRVYFNDVEVLIGLEVGRYGTGNISWARLDGESLSNARAREITGSVGMGKFYYDVAEGRFVGRFNDTRNLTAQQIINRAAAAVIQRIADNG